MSEVEEVKARPRGALTNAAWNAFGTLFGIVITFLLAPLLIHHLGADQWGLLLLVWSITGVLGLANFGVGEATLRFIAHYYGDGDMAGVNRVLRATVTFYLSICSIISAFLFAGAPMVAQWVKVPTGGQYPVEWLLRLAALLFSFGMITNAYRSIPMAMQRYDISSRIGLAQSMVRSLGVILLVLAGLGVVHIVAWEVLVAGAMLGVQIGVARRLLPGVRCFPAMSFSGMREILGYSVFSFLTHIFLTIYREGGKLILGNRVGTASVAYLGTPDNIAHRLHTVVVSGIETLMPRFSASRDPESMRTLLVTSTWTAITCGVVLYFPLAVLMPDFLRLWIDPDFARKSAAVGQLLTLSFIAPSGFAPIATLFRGMGKPSFVTLVMALAGLIVLVTTLLLVSSLGPLGVGYGYVLSAIAWFGGLLGGWLYLYGKESIVLLIRVAGLPIALGCGLTAGQIALRDWWGGPGWIGLFVMGGLFAIVNAVVILGVDRALGGDSPAEYLLGRILRLAPFAAFRRHADIG
ncbi:MAG TPA: MATE family efflux transporter [Terrimicrobiaceae bacterium]